MTINEIRETLTAQIADRKAVSDICTAILQYSFGMEREAFIRGINKGISIGVEEIKGYLERE